MLQMYARLFLLGLTLARAVSGREFSALPDLGISNIDFKVARAAHDNHVTGGHDAVHAGLGRVGRPRLFPAAPPVSGYIDRKQLDMPSAHFRTADTKRTDVEGKFSSQINSLLSLDGGKKCRADLEPARHLRYSYKSYYYPKHEIEAELDRRPDYLSYLQAEADRSHHVRRNKAEKESRSSYDLPELGQTSCRAERHTLRSFSLYGGHCWVVHSLQQNLHFAFCIDHDKHQMGGQCVPNYRRTWVLAYCNALPYGRRLTRMQLSLATSCSRQHVTC